MVKAAVEEKNPKALKGQKPPKIKANSPLKANSPTPSLDVATRAPSPLQPGVYVGHEQELPVFPRKILLAFTSQNAEAAPPTFGAGVSQLARSETPRSPKVAGIMKSPRPQINTRRIRDRRTRLPQKELKLREEEDLERIAKDKERYLQWKKKVIESARNLQIEVSRFRIET